MLWEIPVVDPTYKDEGHGQMRQEGCNMEAKRLWDHNMP